MHTLSGIKEEMKELAAQMEEDLSSDWKIEGELRYQENCFLDKQEAKRKEEYEKEKTKKKLKKKLRSRSRRRV